jgi:WD40 repeat protein
MQGDKQGDIIATLKGHDDAVNTLNYNHDNNALYSGSTDGTIRIWR